MKGVQFRILTAQDPDLLQERLNRFVEELPEEAILVEVRFSIGGTPPVYAALVQYKEVEPWKE